MLYAYKVHIIEASNNLSRPLAIASLSSSASALFCANELSLFICPLSCATILSDSSSFIVLLSSFCDFASLIGVIYTDTFTSPKVYIPLNNCGKVHILGNVETNIVLAYLLVADTISSLLVLVASIPDGAIKSFKSFALSTKLLSCFVLFATFVLCSLFFFFIFRKSSYSLVTHFFL